jgi:hypothetical protein
MMLAHIEVFPALTLFGSGVAIGAFGFYLALRFMAARRLKKAFESSRGRS